MKKIYVGFVGLGLMGLPMAKNILKNTLFLACLGSQTRSKLEAKKIVFITNPEP